MAVKSFTVTGAELNSFIKQPSYGENKLKSDCRFHGAKKKQLHENGL